ncbi:hypothetical protein A6D6_01407 [Alcanivorax xiamenensis]|uniref:Uncharacterized protein n=1 Tax=Alcanivorax xiamenensis TaxID=1177156 RepID=A0ABQ6YAM2_9GAMM|nr:hypothetical protein A6D6_01407 [Alcanivorax xiamenensis]
MVRGAAASLFFRRPEELLFVLGINRFFLHHIPNLRLDQSATYTVLVGQPLFQYPVARIQKLHNFAIVTGKDV